MNTTFHAPAVFTVPGFVQAEELSTRDGFAVVYDTERWPGKARTEAAGLNAPYIVCVYRRSASGDPGSEELEAAHPADRMVEALALMVTIARYGREWVPNKPGECTGIEFCLPKKTFSELNDLLTAMLGDLVSDGDHLVSILRARLELAQEKLMSASILFNPTRGE